MCVERVESEGKGKEGRKALTQSSTSKTSLLNRPYLPFPLVQVMEKWTQLQLQQEPILLDLDQNMSVFRSFFFLLLSAVSTLIFPFPSPFCSVFFFVFPGLRNLIFQHIFLFVFITAGSESFD